MGNDTVSRPPRQHVVLFPFMAKGHIIPLLQLARLLLLRRRHITVSIFTTPANRPFIATFLAGTPTAIVELRFPENVAGIPAGVESIDALPSMSLFHTFAKATELMKADFERALKNLDPPVSFLVSDVFLWWTVESASELGFPRFVSYGSSTYAVAVSTVVATSGLLLQHEPERKTMITVPGFPWIKVNRNEFDPVLENPQANPVGHGFVMKWVEATNRSFGIVANSFYELEPVFIDHWNRDIGPKVWPIGPLCLQAQPESLNTRDVVHQWLDEKLEKDESSSVLYVAFGSQVELSSEQVREIAKGLEESYVKFVWVIRKPKDETEDSFPDGFENRVKNRGMVVRDWVDQMGVLNHKSVQGFLSHCGWNSVLESLSAGVPILAWPMMAEQPHNARMVVEEIKVGLRVETSDSSVAGFVRSEELKKMVKELMEGQMGKEVRKKVKEVADMAKAAVEEGGSSWQALDTLIDEACKFRPEK
ncbi:UDP-glucuronosyl/UDP-glucosyltransferase [Parasponia andersonii]|uniref:Glycosyltransferase n=1 Tax=Parasponia andersonii TaxID=3476 RepID=A0A2P5A655_PARAD|nr:UDP-glucuronosyl/UDP-glucosyltransferase [Parasponia andersonii]